MQICLRAAPILLVTFLLHSPAALASVKGTPLVEAGASGLLAGNETIVPSQASIDCTTMIAGSALSLDSAGVVTVAEGSGGDANGSDDVLTLDDSAIPESTELTLSSAVPAFALAGEAETSSITTALALHSSISTASAEESVATPDFATPLSPTIPEPAAWQGFIFGALILIARRQRFARKSA